MYSTEGAGEGQQAGPSRTSGQTRLDGAATRDQTARVRDLAALARDDAADARDVATAREDAAAQRREGAAANGRGDTIVRAPGQRHRAARRRKLIAGLRLEAAAERQAAADDRAQAAQERVHALADREALVAELRRQHELRDKALLHQRRAETLARTLQRSLSPPRLPHIAGIEVAVHYEPAAPEEVGGDFYDLFPLGNGQAGFFLGDVCGKGPEAAALTSLARYTMRTAAMLHERPEEILMNLNAALLMESAGVMQTCSAVYGELEMSAGVAITLAVAGHPPPLVVRSHGSVEMTSAHGTVLGVARNPTFSCCDVALDPGDAIVICSDGIHDTAIDGVRLDESRVAELLSGVAGADAAALVTRLTHAVRDVDRPLRDDVAIMVLRRTDESGVVVRST